MLDCRWIRVPLWGCTDAAAPHGPRLVAFAALCVLAAAGALDAAGHDGDDEAAEAEGHPGKAPNNPPNNSPVSDSNEPEARDGEGDGVVDMTTAAAGMLASSDMEATIVAVDAYPIALAIIIASGREARAAPMPLESTAATALDSAMLFWAIEAWTAVEEVAAHSSGISNMRYTLHHIFVAAAGKIDSCTLVPVCRRLEIPGADGSVMPTQAIVARGTPSAVAAASTITGCRKTMFPCWAPENIRVVLLDGAIDGVGDAG